MLLISNYSSSPPKVFLGKGVLRKIQQIYWRTAMSKCDFNKNALYFKATLLKSHFGVSVLLYHLLLRTFMDGCFLNYNSEVHLGPSKTFMTELFAKIVNN